MVKPKAKTKPALGQVQVPQKALTSPSPVKQAKPKAKSAYEFDAEEIDLQTITACTKKLKNASSKEQVLKALKQLSELLEAAPQDASPFGNLGPNLGKNLLDLGGQEDADKDVKLFASVCTIHLLRIFAPETPFDDDQLRAVFKLFIWSMERLCHTSLPTFPILVSLLHVAADTKLYLLMMDIDQSDLTEALVLTLLKAVRDDNVEAIQVHAHQVLCGVLEEGGVDGLSDAMVTCLLKSLAGVPPCGAAGQKLGGLVLQASEKVARPAVQKVLLQLLEGRIKEPALKTHAAQLLIYLLSVAPDVLLPVLPTLEVELDALEEERRAAAASLMTHLMCSPHAAMLADKYIDVARLYLDRYRDMSPDVRVMMLHATKSLMASSIAPVQEQAIAQATDRLTDPDESVRVVAVKSLCEVAVAHLEVVPHHVIAALLGRLLDAKPAVRKEAATGLVGVFRHMAALVAPVGAVPDTLDIELLTLPARLAAMTRTDADTRGHVMQLLASPGLMPAAGVAATPAGMATVWALVWSACDTRNHDAMLRMLRYKGELCRSVAALLSVRKHMLAAKASASASQQQQPQSVPSVDVEVLARRKRNLCVEVLEALGGPGAADSASKLSGHLQSLLDFKDAKVFDRLAVLCQPTTTEADARAARKDLIERVGSKSPLGHFTALLTASFMPNLITPSAMLGLAALAVPIDPVTATGSQPQDGPQSDGSKTAIVLSQTVVSPQVKAAAGQLQCAAAKLAPGLLVHVVGHMAKALVQLAAQEPQRGAETETAGNGKQGSKKGAGSKVQKGSKAPQEHPEQALRFDMRQGLVVLVVLANAMRSRIDVVKQGIRLDPLPAELPTCLHRLCTHGPPKVAQLAVFVIASLGPAALTPADGDGAGPSAPAAAAATTPSSSSTLLAVQPLSEELCKALTAEGVNTPQALAAVHALCSIGCIAPAVFAGAADQLVRYVTEELLDARDPGGVAASTAAHTRDTAPAPLPHIKPKMYQGHEAPRGGLITQVKCKALLALSKGLSPAADAGPLPEATHRAVAQLLPVLESLSDVDTDVSQLAGVDTPDDAACVRLAAARALLRLSSRHEVRIPPSTYTTLALVIQDPSQAVRACFGAKLALHVAKLQAVSITSSARRKGGAGGGQDWQPSKYAAMLALAVVDPVDQLRVTTCNNLHSYLVGKRAAALAAARQAALAGEGAGGGAVGLPAQPEFTLPCLLYLLATHPDCPEVQDKASGSPAAAAVGKRKASAASGDDDEEEQEEAEQEEEAAAGLAPFSRMLQTLIEPLMQLQVAADVGGGGGAHSRGRAGAAGGLGPSRGGAAHAGAGAQAAQANYPLIKKLLLSVKSTTLVTEDVLPGATRRLRSLCDLGLGLAAAILSRECEKAGVTDPPPSHDHPAEIRLPKNLFDCSPSAAGAGAGGRRVKDSHLPPGYQVTLDPGVTALFSGHAVEGVAVRGQAGRKRKAASKPGAAGKQRRVGGAAGGGKVKVKRRAAAAGSGSDDDEGDDDDRSDVEGDGGEEEQAVGQRPAGKQRGRGNQAAIKQGRAATGIPADSDSDADVAAAKKRTPTSGGKSKAKKTGGQLPAETPTRRLPGRAGRAVNMGVDLLPDDMEEEE